MSYSGEHRSTQTELACVESSILQSKMSTEPLRRVLFPTPMKNDDGTSSRSIQRIRPKPELTPVNLESTPTTFKQLVENSPVPLAVAAAKAAMRAAESAQNGRPIMTEMTRAAEEVVKNSEYNVIRPPHLSPRPLPEPSRQDNVPARSSSALLPPIPSPSTRPAAALTTFRRMFMRQQQARSWSSTPVPTGDDLPIVNEIARKPEREEKKASTSPVHVPRNRIPSFRQPNFVPPTSKKRVRKSVTAPGNQPHSLSKYDPLKRLFGSPAPLPIATADETDETRTISDDDHVDNEKRTSSSSKTVKSSRKQPKKRPRTLAKTEAGTAIPDDELNESPAMRTRSAKRSRRVSKTSDADAFNDTKPRKKRRMSEVLRLQKALESAAWTNSVDVEKQTEVIVISASSPDRPRPDVSIKFENKTTHDKSTVGKSVAVSTRRKLSGLKKESKPRKTGRTNGIRQKVITKQKSDTKPTSLGRRTVDATKSKVASVKKSVKRKSAVLGKDRAVDGSRLDIARKANTKAAREKKKDRLRRLEAITAADKRRMREKVISEKTAEALPDTHSNDTRIPLKKRLSPEKKKDMSLAEVVTTIYVPCVDAKEGKATRKSPHPKRLGVSKSKETSTAMAASPEPAGEDEMSRKEPQRNALQPENPRPQRTSIEERLSETTDSEATLSVAERP